MDFSWSSFFLEILNFLVLVWILKRFLYKPVLQTVNKRRKSIEDSLAEAGKKLAQAEELESQYRNRLEEWDRYRQGQLESLNQDLDKERGRQLESLQLELEQEKEKARVANARRQQDLRREIEEQALEQSSRFAASLLRHGAGPQTETGLIDLILKDLKVLSGNPDIDFRHTYGEAENGIEVESAFEIDADHKQQLIDALAPLLPEHCPVSFHVNPDLLAGLHIRIGTWQLHANLRDELRGFQEISHAR